MQKSKLERITQFKAAFDKRSTDPKKDYGIHPVQCWMLVKGPKGVVHFTFSTGMYLPETLQRVYSEGGWKPIKMTNKWWAVGEPMGFDVGYHSPKKMYKGQEVVWPTRTVYPKGWDWEKTKTLPPEERMKMMAKIKFKKIGKKAPNCMWLGNKPCYSDGSGMRAETFLRVLISKGSDEIWKMLETEYHERFDTK